ncbi:MAG: hypothetical protein JO332_06210 [Planctomycetaceae bacterium]|nr:hypothetical protein [Planctomycetaceae bacterium]
MKRARWAVVAGVLAVAAAAAVVVLRPRPPERFPLAELVPADALFYAGFSRYEELESLPGLWTQELRKKLEPARVHLSGGIALYVDRAREWVLLVRLTRGSAMLAGAETENGAAVFAQTPEALSRHRTREGSLAELAEFKELGLRGFLNLERLKPKGRLRDYSAVGFEIGGRSPLTIKGRALYRGGLFRTYLEQYVQAPRRGLAEGPAPVKATLTEHFPRLWEELVHDLDPIDAEKAEREAQLLSRDFLEGRSFREFLGRIGPSGGFSVEPAPGGKPALLVWVELPDDGTRDVLAKMLHRGISDAIRVRRDRGLPPLFEVAAEGSIWRVKLSSAKALRYGDAFSPAYTFEKNRFVFSTCATLLEAPPLRPGDAHVAAGVAVGPLLELLRALAPQAADDAFRGEAERRAAALLLRTYSGAAMTALKRQFPEPADLAKFQEQQKAQFEARALEEISKTLPWQEELTRVRAEIEAWADRLSPVDRAEASGRFTSDGFDFTATISASQK